MHARVSSTPFLFLFFLAGAVLLVPAVVAIPSLNERLAVTRTVESTRCLSTSVLRFVNATLLVLSARDADDIVQMEADAYARLFGRFMSHVTQSMASGLPFCGAFARACAGLVVEWTTNRVPAPESNYRQHCESIMRATPEADEYLYDGPAFRNELYRCLRVAMLLPPPVSPWDLH